MLKLFRAVANWFYQIFWSYQFEVALVGLQGAGKTSISRLLTGKEFTEERKMTVGFQMTKITKGHVTMVCWDIAGQKRFRTAWVMHCEQSHVIIFVLDSTSSPAEIDAARDELAALIGTEALHSKPVLVLANKVDLTKPPPPARTRSRRAAAPPPPSSTATKTTATTATRKATETAPTTTTEAPTPYLTPEEIKSRLRFDVDLFPPDWAGDTLFLSVSAKTKEGLGLVEKWLLKQAQEVNR